MVSQIGSGVFNGWTFLKRQSKDLPEKNFGKPSKLSLAVTK